MIKIILMTLLITLKAKAVDLSYYPNSSGLLTHLLANNSEQGAGLSKLLTTECLTKRNISDTRLKQVFTDACAYPDLLKSHIEELSALESESNNLTLSDIVNPFVSGALKAGAWTREGFVNSNIPGENRAALLLLQQVALQKSLDATKILFTEYWFKPSSNVFCTQTYPRMSSYYVGYSKILSLTTFYNKIECGLENKPCETYKNMVGYLLNKAISSKLETLQKLKTISTHLKADTGEKELLKATDINAVLALLEKINSTETIEQIQTEVSNLKSSKDDSFGLKTLMEKMNPYYWQPSSQSDLAQFYIDFLSILELRNVETLLIHTSVDVVDLSESLKTELEPISVQFNSVISDDLDFLYGRVLRFLETSTGEQNATP